MTYNNKLYHRLSSSVTQAALDAEGYCLHGTKQDGTEVIICSMSNPTQLLPASFNEWVLQKDMDHQTTLGVVQALTWFDINQDVPS